MTKTFIEIIKGIFDIKDFSEVEKLQEEKGGRIADILIKRKLITERQLIEAFSALYSMEFWPELPLDKISSDYIDTVPIQFLKKNMMVPLFDKKSDEKGDSKCIIAVNDPSCFQQIDDLIRLLEIKRVKIVLSEKNTIISAINMSYDFNRDSAQRLVQDLEETEDISVTDLEKTADLLDDTSDAPIIKLVNQILSQSIKARASDIHIEPYQEGIKVRHRVDGILTTLLTPPKWIQASLISRIKVMARMNIAEKRLPQDGRINIKIGEQEIDVRVSTIPTSFGERVVLRLLDKTSSILKLSEIGFDHDKLWLIKNLVKFPNGIILVTGPTGSGKTTTLYAMLAYINKPDINIITIEDPIEYQLEGISQIQVNPKIDLTFAKGLRSIVRQDPDVILIGEIRDRETAEIAVQSALTGHLVFSTLHTNDSASAVARLIDIGIEPFLLSSSLICIMAQRLVRVLCNNCKQEYKLDTAELKAMDMDPPDHKLLNLMGMTVSDLKRAVAYKPVGCDKCFNTGYKGRIGIFEIMTMSDKLKTLILKTYDSNEIKKEAVEEGMLTLKQAAVQKVLEGQISVEEVIRVAQK